MAPDGGFPSRSAAAGPGGGLFLRCLFPVLTDLSCPTATTCQPCQWGASRFLLHQANAPPPVPPAGRPGHRGQVGAAAAGQSALDTAAAWVPGGCHGRVPVGATRTWLGLRRAGVAEGGPTALLSHGLSQRAVRSDPGSVAADRVAGGAAVTLRTWGQPTSADRCGRSGRCRWPGRSVGVLAGLRVGPAGLVGSWLQSPQQPGAVEAVADPVGAGGSARAAPPAGRLIAAARTAADADGEDRSGAPEKRRVIVTFQSPQSPAAAIWCTVQSSTTRRRAANPRLCGPAPRYRPQSRFSGGSAIWSLRTFPRPTMYPRPGMKSGLTRAQGGVQQAVAFDVAGVEQQAPAAGLERLGKRPGRGPGGRFGLAHHPLIGLDGRRDQLRHAGLGHGVGELGQALDEDGQPARVVRRNVHQVLHDVGDVVRAHQRAVPDVQ